MKKGYLSTATALSLLLTVWISPVQGQEAARQEMQEQIKQLRNMLQEFNERLSSMEEKLEESEPAEVQEKVNSMQGKLWELDDRIAANERHTVTDKLRFSVDLRSEFTYLQYNDARVLQEWNQSMLSLWAFDRLALPFPADTTDPGNVGTSGLTASGYDVTGDGLADYTFNTDFVGAYGAELMPFMPDMFLEGMLAGFYLPDGAAAFGFDPGDYVSQAEAANLMITNGLDPTSREDVVSFFSLFTSAAPGAQAVIASSATGPGNPLFSREFTKADLEKYQNLFNLIDPQSQDIDNDGIWTTRARLDMRADPTPNVTFQGRLTANKVWGDSTGVKWYTGDFSSITMDGNVHQKGSDSAIRLERGYVTYRDVFDDVNWHFSLGRRPALDGPPWHLSQHSVIGGSPLAHAINWQFDGASLGFDLSQKVGVEGFNFKLCYGVGFESGPGSGNSYSMSYESEIDDTNFLGYIFRPYKDDKTAIYHMYAHAFDISDGFTGLVAMPFSIAGIDVDNDGVFDTYFLDANRGGYISRMEPTTNIGDMDLATLLVQSKFRGIDWFVDLAMNYANPSSRSQNPMMQFIGTDSLLNSFGETESHTGFSVWVGAKFPITPTNGALGLEYNWGSKYWFGFNGGEDTLNASKLATRGSVYEIYYHQPIVEDILLLSLGVQYYDYKYTGSGNPLGEPKQIEDVTALDAIMPVPDELLSSYINLNYRW